MWGQLAFRFRSIKRHRGQPQATKMPEQTGLKVLTVGSWFTKNMGHLQHFGGLTESFAEIKGPGKGRLNGH